MRAERVSPDEYRFGQQGAQVPAGEGVSTGGRPETLDAAAHFEYHTEFDWDSEHGGDEWSIRCYDVHKRLGGVPVLDGLNVAIPDQTITTVLGGLGTGKSVLIKHLIGLMFPDSGEDHRKGVVGAQAADAGAAGAAPQDRGAVPGRRAVRVDVAV